MVSDGTGENRCVLGASLVLLLWPHKPLGAWAALLTRGSQMGRICLTDPTSLLAAGEPPQDGDTAPSPSPTGLGACWGDHNEPGPPLTFWIW